MNLPIGTLLQGGRYEILRYISSGGFGCTYEARDNKFKSKVKSVAIKEFFVKDFCNRDPESNSVLVATQSKTELIERLQQKFIEEAEALYDLAHPNIVRVTDKFEENNTAYYVMDYIDGRSLGKLIDEKGPLGEAEAIDYIKQIASALGFVHSHNRLHLDVKPQNIMIDQSGKAVLIDFGVSKQYDEVNGENTSTLLGCTPGYAPIEQSGNGVSEFYPSTDIYALGATLYKALTGETPLPAHQRASSKRLKELQFPEGISSTTREAVECSMQLYVDNRPQSVAEFLSLLERTDNRVQITDNREQSTDNREQGEELIDDADVEVTVLPDKRAQRTDNRVQRTDNRVQRVNVKAIEAESEETRALEKETERATAKINDPVAKPKKNRTAWVVAVVLLLGILVGGGLFFAFSGGDSDNGSSNGGNERLAAHNNEPPTTVVIEDTEDEKPNVPAAPVVNTDSIVAARMQAYQDSINAANVAREAAEQQAREEAARRERESSSSSARTFTVEGVEFKMVAVKGGTFQMGATSEQQDTYNDERPVHSVTLSDYYIGETEVTQALWQAVMGSNPSSFTGNSQRPVECVSWDDCQTFISRLNSKTGMNFRLPTEAEWEYAARGGNRSNKTQYSGSSNIDNVAWYDNNSGSTTHPVKGKSPNELGLYDMSGNVCEWCSDWYSSDYYSNSPRNNPQGPSSGSRRVLRGGGWINNARYCRVAGRNYGGPDFRYYYDGLRLAL